MIRKSAGLKAEWKEGIRGGQGKALSEEYLQNDEMDGIISASRITLESGSSIGLHKHPNTEELYLVLSGCGLGHLDSESFEVGPGDAWVCKAGHSHGLDNTGEEPLALFAFMTHQIADKP